MNKDISKDFAIQLLTGMYGLDQYVINLDKILSELDDGVGTAEFKAEFRELLAGMMFHILDDLMLPIYKQHADLGSVSTPGDWLKNDNPI